VVTPVDLILSRCRREKLMELYKIPIYHDTREFLCHIAHKRGKLGKVLPPPPPRRGGVVGCVGRTR
jgi:nuclear GTP-binding protein